jgi:hypothetical protein
VNTLQKTHTRSRLTVSKGEVFGHLTVLQEEPPTRKPNGASVRVFLARCSCGKERVVRLHSLTSGKTVSCGHVQREKAKQNKAATTHGLSKTPVYSVWSQMIQRCHNPTNSSYPRYGARGISVCDEWRVSFSAFSEYVGFRPPGMTIDRINSAGNYEPGNVRWATYKEQARNTSRNHLHTIDGVTRCLAEWCEILNEPWTTVKKRVAAGKDPFTRERARRTA